MPEETYEEIKIPTDTILSVPNSSSILDISVGSPSKINNLSFEIAATMMIKTHSSTAAPTKPED